MYRVCVLLVLLETETSVMASWWTFLQPIATFPSFIRRVSLTSPDQVCVLSHSHYYRCVSSLAISLASTYCMSLCGVCNSCFCMLKIFIGVARLHIDSLCVAGHFLVVFCKCLYSAKCLYSTLSSLKKLLFSSQLIFLLIPLLTSSLLFVPVFTPSALVVVVVGSCTCTA